jgi:hypothetical protein
MLQANKTAKVMKHHSSMIWDPILTSDKNKAWIPQLEQQRYDKSSMLKCDSGSQYVHDKIYFQTYFCIIIGTLIKTKQQLFTKKESGKFCSNIQVLFPGN